MVIGARCCEQRNLKREHHDRWTRWVWEGRQLWGLKAIVSVGSYMMPMNVSEEAVGGRSRANEGARR